MNSAARIRILFAVAALAAATAVFLGVQRAEESEARRARLADRVEGLERSTSLGEGDRRARAAAVEMDRAFRRAVSALVDVGDDTAHAYLDETTSAAPPESERSAAWNGIRGVVAAAKATPGARVALYDPPAVISGWASVDRGEWKDVAAWEGRAPEALIRGEFANANSPLPAGTPLVWFSPDAGGAVRLHVLQAYQHTYEDPEKEDSVEVIRLQESSAPFSVPPGMAVRVRCDVVDGAIVQDPVAMPVRGGRAESEGDSRADALVPEDHAVRFASGAKGPRATVSIAHVPSESVLAALGASRQAAPQPLGAWLLLALSVVALAFGAALATRTARGTGPPATDITAEAAHELKTPLTAMRGELEVALRRERTPVEYRETIAGCLEEVKGLQELVSQVLLLSRGMATARADEEVDLAAVIRAEVERVRVASPDRAVEFAAPAGAVSVRGDPSLLARAVGNLLDNAALHSVAGGAIRVRIERSARGSIEATVEDDGPGIPEARRERVFERFYRGPEVGQRGIPGAGLGLPIARFIAEAHGGTLALDPQAPGRARFMMRLPAPGPLSDAQS